MIIILRNVKGKAHLRQNKLISKKCNLVSSGSLINLISDEHLKEKGT